MSEATPARETWPSPSGPRWAIASVIAFSTRIGGADPVGHDHSGDATHRVKATADSEPFQPSRLEAAGTRVSAFARPAIGLSL